MHKRLVLALFSIVLVPILQARIFAKISTLCLGALQSFSSSKPSNAKISITIEDFKASDFANSVGYDHTPFAEWAAEVASHTTSLVSQNKKAEDIFQAAIEARKRLPNGSSNDPRPIAEFRWNLGEVNEGITRDLLGYSQYEESKDKSPYRNNPQHTKWVQDKVIPYVDYRLSQHPTRPMAHNTYTMLNGKEVNTNSIFAPKNKKNIREYISLGTSGLEAKTIYSDVLKRLDLAKALAQSDPKLAHDHLYRAMYGYFTSMPLSSGSASVGRAVFTGMLSSMRGRTTSIYPDIDTAAMVRTETAFIEFMQHNHPLQPRAF